MPVCKKHFNPWKQDAAGNWERQFACHVHHRSRRERVEDIGINENWEDFRAFACPEPNGEDDRHMRRVYAAVDRKRRQSYEGLSEATKKDIAERPLRQRKRTRHQSLRALRSSPAAGAARDDAEGVLPVKREKKVRVG